MSLTIIVLLISLGICILLLGKIMKTPGKLIKKFFLNTLLGVFILWLINTLGSMVGLSIPLNIFTVTVTGILGVPGIAMLALLQIIVK